MGDGVLKSALKSNKKKKKLAIKWADEAGGSLREVQTFEVEKIKNKVASYKNHKELSKKERMLEKETHEHKVTNSKFISFI